MVSGPSWHLRFMSLNGHKVFYLKVIFLLKNEIYFPCYNFRDDAPGVDGVKDSFWVLFRD